MFTYLQALIDQFNEHAMILNVQPAENKDKKHAGRKAINIYCSPRNVTNQMVRLMEDAVEAQGHYFKHFEASRGSDKNDNFFISSTAPSSQTNEDIAAILDM